MQIKLTRNRMKTNDKKIRKLKEVNRIRKIHVMLRCNEFIQKTETNDNRNVLTENNVLQVIFVAEEPKLEEKWVEYI